MYKRSFIKLLLLALIGTSLAGCADSDAFTEFQETREKFGGRIGAETPHSDEKTGGTKEKNTSLQKWYSWQIDVSKQELEAPNGTKLIEAKVVNIVDADTIDIKITNGKEERLRFILVNSPESKGEYKDNPQPFSLTAAKLTEDLLLDRVVFIQKGIEERDQYGRLLAYVWLDNVILNQEVDGKEEVYVVGEKLGMVTINELLLREGLAQVDIFPPNTEYVDEFEKVQKQAKREKKGIWSK